MLSTLSTRVRKRIRTPVPGSHHLDGAAWDRRWGRRSSRDVHVPYSPVDRRRVFRVCQIAVTRAL